MKIISLAVIIGVLFALISPVALGGSCPEQQGKVSLSTLNVCVGVGAGIASASDIPGIFERHGIPAPQGAGRAFAPVRSAAKPLTASFEKDLPPRV